MAAGFAKTLAETGLTFATVGAGAKHLTRLSLARNALVDN